MPEAKLETLPVDVHLILIDQLNAHDVTAYTDCTAKAISTQLSPFLHNIWQTLLQQLTGESTQVSPAHLKSKFVRHWHALQRRCPRCGKRGAPGASEELDTATYMHLCHFVSVSQPLRSTTGAAVTPTEAPADDNAQRDHRVQRQATQSPTQGTTYIQTSLLEFVTVRQQQGGESQAMEQS